MQQQSAGDSVSTPEHNLVGVEPASTSSAPDPSLLCSDEDMVSLLHTLVAPDDANAADESGEVKDPAQHHELSLQESEWDAFLRELGDTSGPTVIQQQSVGDSAPKPEHSGVGAEEVAASMSSGPDPSLLCNDEDMVSLLHTLAAQDDANATDESGEVEDPAQHHELSLREWIQTSTAASRDMIEYAKQALPIALRLTEFIIEAEKADGHDIPLSSIASTNVSVRTKKLPLTPEVVEYVFIVGCVGEDPNVGNAISRLAALGSVLYELFSAEEPLLVGDGVASTVNVNSLDSIHLGSGSPKPEKSHRQMLPKTDDGRIANCMARMETRGLPRSLRNLVRNLLDCQRGDFRQDDSYSSMVDLQLDLQLMMEDPARFFDDIQTNPMPTLDFGDKFYGRKEEMGKLESAHQQHVNGNCCGVTISGGAGVGKSRLALHCLRKISGQSNSYLLIAKFDQNKTQLKPLSTIAGIFSSLCDLVAHDVSSNELAAISNGLKVALGSQAGSLVALVPSFARLLPPSVEAQTFDDCVDSTLSMRFLLGEALRVISSYSRPVVIFIDDIQWADAASPLLIGNLMHSTKGSPVFFTLCYRDEEIGNNKTFDAWLTSLSIFHLKAIDVKELNITAVNTMLSDALHLSPRLTMTLSSAVYSKTAGNPFFLRQLVISLAEQRYIYFSLNSVSWMWDLKKIQDMAISDDIVALLTREMKRLKSDLQMSLTIAACLGSSISYEALSILSQDVNVDLIETLKQVSLHGFMIHSAGESAFRFSHDKIQQTAYELMPMSQRKKNHMRYGLALCSHCLDAHAGGDEMLFIAVNQINKGGPDVIDDVAQKRILASLNLKAGKLAIDLSDLDSALTFFQHGTSFLPEAHWEHEYDLSLDLFDAAAETACSLNRTERVTSYTEKVIANAKSLDDKLNCMYVNAEALKCTYMLQQSMEAFFKILTELKEVLPMAVGVENLSERQSNLNRVLQTTTNDTILSMKQMSDRKFNMLLLTYSSLAQIVAAVPIGLGAQLHLVLRMVELTFQNGLCLVSPLVFTNYGETLMAGGHLEEGCRSGRLALMLCEKKHSSRYRALVYHYVYHHILWAATPLQSIVDAHVQGQKYGQQSGDAFFSMLNWNDTISTGYAAGLCLREIRENFRKHIKEMAGEMPMMIFYLMHVFHVQLSVLEKGLRVATQSEVDGFPGEQEMTVGAENQGPLAQFILRVHQLARALLFGKMKEMSLYANITDIISENNYSLSPFYLMGIFHEGLASFQLARKTDEKEKWMKRGESVLDKMSVLAKRFAWNWDNKRLLLKAERMYCTGEYDRAAPLYLQAIVSASSHKFVHEEAIGSELAGLFYYRSDRAKSRLLLQHSIKCYTKWGALAVAKRIEKMISTGFGSGISHGEIVKELVFRSKDGGSSNKRRSGSGNNLAAARNAAVGGRGAAGRSLETALEIESDDDDDVVEVIDVEGGD